MHVPRPGDRAEGSVGLLPTKNQDNDLGKVRGKGWLVF